jgi:hypothetical protein
MNITRKKRIKECALPSEYCGIEEQIPEYNYSENLKYIQHSPTQRKTNASKIALACLRKGVSVGSFMEKRKSISKSSLFQLKYMTPECVNKCKSYQIKTIPDLIKYLKTHTLKQNKQLLFDICSKTKLNKTIKKRISLKSRQLKSKSSVTNIKLLNSIIHYAINEHIPLRLLPHCISL